MNISEVVSGVQKMQFSLHLLGKSLSIWTDAHPHGTHIAAILSFYSPTGAPAKILGHFSICAAEIYMHASVYCIHFLLNVQRIHKQ